jgi:predicted alpha/beta-hydrolase family hydrolase
MKSKLLKISLGSTGEITGAVTEPEVIKAVMVLAHGAGAGMDHSFMVKLSDQLVSQDIAVFRFNFPYMEKGKGRPDVPAVAHKAIASLLALASSMYPDKPLIAGGKSFGGRMTSQLLSKENVHGVRAIVFYGFPLHPANQPGTERADHLSEVKVPMLFLQGSKDALAELDLIKKVTSSLPLASLHILENADHSFKSGKKEFIVDLSRKTAEWLDEHTIL